MLYAWTMPVPRIIIPIVILLLFGAFFIICAFVIVPYVVKLKLEKVSNTTIAAESKVVI